MDASDNNVIGAFTEEQVSKITGLSVQKLSRWYHTGFFRPTRVEEDSRVPFSRIYSFLDVVALRVIAKLRETYKVPLQHLRMVSHKLSGLDSSKWVKTSLYVHNRKVVFVEPDSKKYREVISGQYVMAVALGVEINQTHDEVRKIQKRDQSCIGVITRNKFVNHNAPVVAGTRIPSIAIWEFYVAGYDVRRIISEYPDLKEGDVLAAIHYHRSELHRESA